MSKSQRDLPVPAEATPQPGQRFLMLASASSPLARLIIIITDVANKISKLKKKSVHHPLIILSSSAHQSTKRA